MYVSVQNSIGFCSLTWQKKCRKSKSGATKITFTVSTEAEEVLTHKKSLIQCVRTSLSTFYLAMLCPRDRSVSGHYKGLLPLSLLLI